MSKLIKWFGSFRKEKNLKEEILYRIYLYRQQITEVNKRRNQMLANGIPEEQIILLDAPEKMLIFMNPKLVVLKHEFISALSQLIKDINTSQVMMTNKAEWQYDIFRCKVGHKEIYCDTEARSFDEDIIIVKDWLKTKKRQYTIYYDYKENIISKIEVFFPDDLKNFKHCLENPEIFSFEEIERL